MAVLTTGDLGTEAPPVVADGQMWGVNGGRNT